MKRYRVLAAGTILGLAVTACGSVPQAGVSAPRTATSSAAPSAPPASSGSAALTVRPAPPSATGHLHVVLHDALPVTYGAEQTPPGVISTEAPDGSVFAAFGPEQAGGVVAAAPGSAVYVVDGDQPAHVAEHPAFAVTALAADDTYLYAAGSNQIVAYNRATGALARTWDVAQPVRLMAASADRLWAVLGGLTGGQVAEIIPGSGGLTTVGNDAKNVESVAAGPEGIYYVESGSATIVHIRPDGTRQQAPANQAVNLQLSGPAAIQAISVIGDQVLLVHDAGQGLDSSSQAYNASTLAGPLSNAPGRADANHAISSLAGPVDLVTAQSMADRSEVGRYNLSTGAVTDAVTYPPSTKGVGPLLGPYPAVFVYPPSGPVYLDRIG